LFEHNSIATRDDLAQWIEHVRKAYSQTDGYTYQVTGVVTKRFTLLDTDVTTGDATQAKLWEFMQG
jgi:hypothetical protein